MVRYVRARDSRRVGDQSFGFSPSLSSLLFPFPSVTLSNSFLSLVSHSFSSSLYPSSFLPLLRHSISLSYFLLLSVLFALQLFSFLSLTFFCFLSLPLFSYSLPPCSLSPFLFVLLLLSSLSVALPNVFLPLLLIKDLDSGFSVTQESATEGFG